MIDYKKRNRKVLLKKELKRYNLLLNCYKTTEEDKLYIKTNKVYTRRIKLYLIKKALTEVKT